MSPLVAATRAWADEGTRLLLTRLDAMGDVDLAGPCALPGWSRRQLLAHVASNAEAIGRLLTWARTGVETPMYASPTQRAADIDAGAARADLREWVRTSAQALSAAMDQLPAEAWSARVVTAQGREVPATETCWMRARETCVHALDLGGGATFADLPDGFLEALVTEVVAWRSARTGPAVLLTVPGAEHRIEGEREPLRLALPLPTAAAWLTGRADDPDLPTLPGWL